MAKVHIINLDWTFELNFLRPAIIKAFGILREEGKGTKYESMPYLQQNSALKEIIMKTNEEELDSFEQKIFSECMPLYNNLKLTKEKEFKDFIEKHRKIISCFPENTFVINNEGIFFDSAIKEIDSEIADEKTPMAQFFASDVSKNYPTIQESESERELNIDLIPGWPSNYIKPFEVDFYNDLYNLFGDGQYMESKIFGTSVPDLIVQHYLKKDGIVWDCDFSDDDEDY